MRRRRQADCFANTIYKRKAARLSAYEPREVFISSGFCLLANRNKARTAYLHCIKLGTNIDPACKSGVFLREIAKRLIKGLETAIPDLQERIDHIFHKQLFAIAITEMTSLLSRRSSYCTKFPNGEYSVSHFNDIEGNIRFKKIQHVWRDGRCVFCGARKEEYDRDASLETHAYEFIIIRLRCYAEPYF